MKNIKITKKQRIKNELGTMTEQCMYYNEGVKRR